MVRRSLHYANYSLTRLRGRLLLVVLAITGVAAGACGVAGGMVLIGVFGIAESDSGLHFDGTVNALAAAGVIAAAAAAVIATMIWLSDRTAPLMVRAGDHDRMHARWGLRMTAVTAAALPFALTGVVIVLIALGFEFG